MELEKIGDLKFISEYLLIFNFNYNLQILIFNLNLCLNTTNTQFSINKNLKHKTNTRPVGRVKF